MDHSRVAILGTKGIGKFHAREFRDAGCEIVGILGASEESSMASAAMLKEKFDIETRPYHDLETLLKEAEPHIVSVCTPNSAHYGHAKAALESGANVLCEKPVYWDMSLSPQQNLARAQELFELASEKGAVLGVNTQLVYLFQRYLGDFHGIISARDSFDFNLRTADKSLGLEIPVDLLPHPLSMLLKTSPDGEISGIEGTASETMTDLHFDFGANGQKIAASLTLEKNSSARLGFGFDDAYVTREARPDHDDKTRMVYSLKHPNQAVEVRDNLKVSIVNFTHAARYNRPLMVSPQESLRNMELQAQLMQYLATHSTTSPS